MFAAELNLFVYKLCHISLAGEKKYAIGKEWLRRCLTDEIPSKRILVTKLLSLFPQDYPVRLFLYGLGVNERLKSSITPPSAPALPSDALTR